MIRHIRAAGEALADTIWWFKGRQSVSGDHRDPPEFEAQTRFIRDYLRRLATRETVVVAPPAIYSETIDGTKILLDQRHDGGLMVISYAEFEHLADGLREDATIHDQSDGRRYVSIIKASWDRGCADIKHELDLPF